MNREKLIIILEKRAENKKKRGQPTRYLQERIFNLKMEEVKNAKL
jgi:hypothetical protein